MVREKVLVTFLKLNGIINHSYNPYFIVNVIFFTFFEFIHTYQNSHYKLSVENHFWQNQVGTKHLQ